jgi:hypothetical protein
MVAWPWKGFRSMTFTDVLHTIADSVAAHGHIAFPGEVLSQLSPEDVASIREAYGSLYLMKLPDHEIAFFEWVKEVEPEVWNDIWASTDEAPYLVSLAHLPDFAGPMHPGSYWIRDLQSVPNYFFMPDMILQKESQDFLAASRHRLLDQQRVSLPQAFALQASVGPVDLWHFAYHHQIPLTEVREAIAALVEDQIVVHVPRAEHLSDYFNVD